MKKIVILMLVAMISLPFAAFAQEPSADSESGLGVDTSGAVIADDINVKNDVNNYLADKGWGQGENTNADGTTFFVAVGYGVIQAPRGSSAYIDARRRAFDKAMLKAKDELLKYLGTTISTKTEYEYQEGDFPVPGKKENKEPSILDKGKMLIHAKLDELLKKKGIVPDSEEAKEEVPKILNSESFRKTIKAVSQSYIAGLQAWKVFEGSPDGKKGKIGVVAIWSDALNRVASSIGTNTTPPPGKPKSIISSQVPEDKDILLNTFGVRQTRDENGEYVILAFGQAGASGKSAMAEEMASEKANGFAMAYIREFTGETAKRTQDMHDAETTKELENGSEVYEDESAMKLAIETKARQLSIKGIKTIKNWEAPHPLTGQTVFGSVVAWSPSSAERAGNMRQRMQPGAAGEQRINSASPGSQKGGYSGSGMEGDDEDF